LDENDRSQLYKIFSDYKKQLVGGEIGEPEKNLEYAMRSLAGNPQGIATNSAPPSMFPSGVARAPSKIPQPQQQTQSPDKRG
jgi:hypothetical protein